MPTFNPKDSREGYILKLKNTNGKYYWFVKTATDPSEIQGAYSPFIGGGVWARTYFGFDTSSLAGETIASATLRVSMYHDSNTATCTLTFYVGSDLLSDPLSSGDWNDYVSMSPFATLSTSTLSTSSSSPTRVSKSVPVDKINTSGWTDFGIINPHMNEVTTYTGTDYMYTVNNSDSSLWPELEVVLAGGERRIFHAVHQ